MRKGDKMTSSMIALAACSFSVLYARKCFNMGAAFYHLLPVYQVCAALLQGKKELKCRLNECGIALKQIFQK